jgi:hypothetical protein
MNSRDPGSGSRGGAPESETQIRSEFALNALSFRQAPFQTVEDLTHAT